MSERLATFQATIGGKVTLYEDVPMNKGAGNGLGAIKCPAKLRGLIMDHLGMTKEDFRGTFGGGDRCQPKLAAIHAMRVRCIVGGREVEKVAAEFEVLSTRPKVAE
jgi:hypothetical protein